MKSTQLLSVVLSLIMFTGVTAGNAAFADSDDYYDELEDQLEDFCEMTTDEQSDFFDEHPDLAEYTDRLAEICAIDDVDERYDALYDVIDEVIIEERDDFDDEFDEAEDEYDAMDDDVIDSFEDCVEAGYPVMESYPEQCAVGDMVFVNDDDDYETDEEDHDEYDDDYDKYGDDYERDYTKVDSDMREKLERYCDLSDADRDAYIAEHDKTTDHREKMDRYCTLDEDGRADFIEEHRADYIAHMKEKYSNKKHHMNYDRLCAMAESDRAGEVTDVAKLDRINKWCDMTPEEREEYKKEHHSMMKDKMHDKMGMMHDKMMECGCHEGDDGTMQCPMMDANTDMQCAMMADKMHDKMTKMHDKMKMLGEDHRLKAMIKAKYDISDERLDEIKMKYREKHGDLSDERKSEIKMKFKKHMAEMKFKMSDERRADIHDRVAEMKAFKAELREKASTLSDEEKQQLRSDFIEKAKDLQLAWITPRAQMQAGIDAAEIECREGYSLVNKVSNGVAMCLTADAALKMIDRGIVVPSN